MPAASKASRTAGISPGAVVTSQLSPLSATSSAPASSAASMMSSSLTVGPRRAFLGTRITPLRSNCQATAPGSAMDPPFLEKMARMSEPVRLRLSVRVSMITATPDGA